jgi:xanthine dehydrogenase accessory factor
MNFDKLNNLLYAKLVSLLLKNKSCVLATVTSATGSTPQKPGSSAIFGKNGVIAGTVGGGVVELAVTKIATQYIRAKKTGFFTFDLNHEIGGGQGPICGGGMNIFIDANPAIHLPVFEALIKSTQKRMPGVLVTLFSGANKTAEISRKWLTKENMADELMLLPDLVIKSVREMLNNPVSDDFREIQLSEPSGSERKIAFLETVVPPPLLLVAGAGHVGKAVTHIGNWLGFEVAVWDDRPEFATAKNLPEARQTFSSDIALLKEKLAFGNDTFVVIVTRGHKNDAEVLKEFIHENVAYVGMMGSKRKIAQVRQMFLENGWATDEQWNRVHTPIGIEIGSVSVNEIAVSIAAELIAVRNGKGKRD